MTEKQHRGFAAMDPKRQREIASMGGKAIAASQRSFSQNRALAVSAGKKGGKAVRAENRSFSTNRALAVRAGHLGGIKAPSATRSFATDPELARRAGRAGGTGRPYEEILQEEHDANAAEE